MIDLKQAMRQLSCEPLTAQAFAPFGLVIDPGAATPELINGGTTRRYSDLAALDLNADAAQPRIGIYDADARQFPLPLLKLERHRQAAQVFLPLGMHRFVVVVCPGDAAPQFAHLRAFLSAPGQGISLHRDTWHHGLVALGDGDRFAVIEGGNYRSDCEEVPLVEPVVLLRPAHVL